MESAVDMNDISESLESSEGETSTELGELDRNSVKSSSIYGSETISQLNIHSGVELSPFSLEFQVNWPFRVLRRVPTGLSHDFPLL